MAFHYDIVRRNEVNKNLHTQENLDANKKNKQHYIDILSRSVFSICPRGSNAGSNRFWESIKAGSIPILIADDWVLPEYDWENTIIRIKEKDWVAGISNDSYFIDNIIKTVDIETLRSNCLKYNMDFYKPNINVTGVLTVDGVM